MRRRRRRIRIIFSLLVIALGTLIAFECIVTQRYKKMLDEIDISSYYESIDQYDTSEQEDYEAYTSLN